MRFLILSQYYAPEIGAPQVRLRAIARTLKELGHEVEVITAMPNYPDGKIAPGYRGKFYVKEEMDGVTVHRVWLYAATGAGASRLLNYLSFALTSLLPMMRCRRGDYVFVESPPLFLSVPGYIAVRLMRSRMVFNVADLWPDSVKELDIIRNARILRLANQLELWSYRVAYKVTGVTEGICQIISDKGVPAAKLLFLPNGVDTELFQPRPPDQDLARSLNLHGKKIILYAGTLGYAQGLDTVLGAARRLRERSEVMFVFIGGGPEKPRLKEMVSRQGLENVRFLDLAPLEYVARLYSLALAGLVILRDIPLFEGARPSKMLPAMASGVPVLYSGTGEGARLVEKAHAGVVTSPENLEALAQGVLQLIDNPARAIVLGRNGRKYAEENFGWATTVKNWVSTLG